MRIAFGLALLLLSACRATAPVASLGPAQAGPAQGGEAAVPPDPSPGCSSKQAPVAGNRRLTSSGRTRRFILVLPPQATKGPLPLVLNFHGLVESPQLQQLLTQMDAEAKQRGLALVYPQGVGLSWNAGTCCGRALDERVDDVRFVRDLVRELGREMCIDRSRIFATGMSNGGLFSYRLACEASDLIAAVAPVSAVDAMPRCEPARPVPVLAFNGTSDPVVHYGGGWWSLRSATDSIADWARRDRCSSATRVAYHRGDARCEAHEGCAADVVFCSLSGGGHTWPGGTRAPFLGRTSSDIDATATILDFFAAHPRRAAPRGQGSAPR